MEKEEVDEASSLCSAIQQMAQSSSQITLDDMGHVLRLVKLIHRLFIVDLERAMEQGMDALLWTTIKQLIDRIREEHGDGPNANFENAISLCISWLCDLSLSVYSKYQLPPIDIPSFVSLSTALRVEQTTCVPPAIGNSFLAFLCLRLGDLFRYKGDYDLCSHLYHCSLRAKPALGDAWNQLGVLATLKVKPLDSLYLNTRALHCPVPFTPAATNISNIFRNYAGKEVREDDSFSEQYLAVLAKCHFLMPVSDDAIARIGPQITNRKLLAAPLALLQPLGETPDEIRTRHNLIQLLSLAFNKITSLLLTNTHLRPDLLLCIVLLLRVPSVCRNEPALIAALSRSPQDVIFDSEKLETFRCFSESDPFEYPVNHGQIADHLAELLEQQEQDVNNLQPHATSRRRRRTVLCAPQQTQRIDVANH
ncbi:Smg-7p [Parelaphostrongylus tenuis]|uniref:Smg-7p n=1 Tax=Parelaphostrongylus tenuis TaxID=148309 RepID=A0AAD5QDP3_PARTN|nr:Smg-7p [Parelaphostrongylus tenuis]